MSRSLRTAILSAALLALAWPGVAAAQEEDESAYVYASYYECGPGMGAAVATLRDDWGPILQAPMQSGAIAAWGVMTHNTGNPWSVVAYEVGNDLPALMSALEAGIAEYFEQHPEEGAAFGEACPRHEDYVWVTDTGSEAGAGIAMGRPEAGLSVYWVCDEATESVADLIVQNLWAPILDRMVEEGSIRSWGWLEHYLGGKYRRLLVTDGTSHADLIAARDRLEQESAEEDPYLATAFSNVCNGHTDVLYDIVAGAP